MNLIPTILASPYALYYLLVLVCVLLVAIMLLSRLSETVVIEWGVYILGVWLFAGFLCSFRAEAYWYYLLQWFLSALAGFAFWFLLIYLCERFGRPYTGDGGMIMLLPVYFLPVAIVCSIGIKIIVALVNFF